MAKSPGAFRTISEVSGELDVPAHVLRFWETKFTQVKPLKRGGGRRYYRPEDVNTLRRIRHLLYEEKYTIKGVQKLFKENGVFPKNVDTLSQPAPEIPGLELETPSQKDTASALTMGEAGAGAAAATPSRSPMPTPPAHTRDDGAAPAGQIPMDVRQLFSEIRGELLQVREILAEASLSD